MRRPFFLPALLLAVLLLTAAGCGNPMKRPPANVYPGSEEYDTRIATFKINPSQAHDIALGKARTDNRLQFVSRRPTVVVKRWYVFSMPQASGANLRGYHVNGDTGEVRFMSEDKAVPQSRR